MAAQHGFELMVRSDHNTMTYACTCGWVSEPEPTFTNAENALATHIAESTTVAEAVPAGRRQLKGRSSG
jgi:hypothetical protein